MGRQLDIDEPHIVYKAADIAFDLSVSQDLSKAVNGNKAADRRSRKAFLELQKACKTARLELMKIINKEQ